MISAMKGLQNWGELSGMRGQQGASEFLKTREIKCQLEKNVYLIVAMEMNPKSFQLSSPPKKWKDSEAVQNSHVPLRCI